MTHAWTDDPAPAPRGRNFLTESEWEALKRDYLIGYSARELAERFGVGLSTVRLKARTDNWRRRDRPADPDLLMSDDDLPEADAAADLVVADVEDWSDMTSGARSRVRRAIRDGNPAQAASWMRLYERLRTRTLAAAEDEISQDEAAEPSAPARPDHIDYAYEKALRVEKLIQQTVQAANSGDPVAMAEVEAAIDGLKARRLAPRRERPDEGPVMNAAWAELDALLDSLD